MNAERWGRIEELFYQADELPAGERTAFWTGLAAGTGSCGERWRACWRRRRRTRGGLKIR